VIVFFDTSALIKRYLEETGSDAVAELCSSASLAAASQLLYAEMIATFARKRREDPSNAAVIDQRLQAFRTDFQTLTRIALDDDVHRRVDDLLGRHPLRGADAVHLASAVLVRDVLQEQVTFACADQRLVDAARAEGLLIAP
jgi:predicted nucleic acid-binding protein